jgi:hypothetical protein
MAAPGVKLFNLATTTRVVLKAKTWLNRMRKSVQFQAYFPRTGHIGRYRNVTDVAQFRVIGDAGR